MAAANEAAGQALDPLQYGGEGHTLQLLVPEHRLVATLKALSEDRVEVLSAAAAASGTDGLLGEGETVRRQVAHTHLDLALDVGGIGVWEWDINSGTVRWSRHLEVIHGYEVGAFQGTFEAFAATIHADDRNEVLAGVRAAIENQSDLANEYRFVRQDGSTGWMRGRGRLISDELGRPSSFVGVAIDETAQAEQRALLRERTEALEASAEERASLVAMLQKTLLPHQLTSPDGMVVDTAFRAAGVEATGDFVDLYRTRSDGEWLLVIGDIAGHGPEAAVLTGSVRRSIHSAAMLVSDPSAVLAAANRVHLETTIDHRFATAHVAVIRRGPDGMVDVDVATGGHPPLLVLRASGSHEWLAGAGPAIGILRDVEFTSRTTRLGPGDTMVAYTDGITEAGYRTVGPFGEERLARRMAAILAEVGPAAAAQSLLAEVVAYVDGSLHDDAACVVVGIA